MEKQREESTSHSSNFSWLYRISITFHSSDFSDLLVIVIFVFNVWQFCNFTPLNDNRQFCADFQDINFIIKSNISNRKGHRLFVLSIS